MKNRRCFREIFQLSPIFTYIPGPAANWRTWAAAGMRWGLPTGKVVGWVKADDAFEWKQTMCLAYTNPYGRSPVMMFEHRKSLEELIRQSAEEQAARAAKMYELIESKDIPADFPVISVEPKLVNIFKHFYLMPILDFRAIEIDNRPSRLLKLAAVKGHGEKRYPGSTRIL